MLLMMVSEMGHPAPLEVLVGGLPEPSVQKRAQLGASGPWLPGERARRGGRYKFRSPRRMGPGGGFQVGPGRGAHFRNVERLLSNFIALSHTRFKRNSAHLRSIRDAPEALLRP